MPSTLTSPHFSLSAGLIIICFLALPMVADGQTQFDVNVLKKHQVMDGTGGNAYGFITSSNWDPQVLDYIVNDINVSHVRFRSSTGFWEPSNDNGNPYSIDWSDFNDSGYVHQDFMLLEELSNAGIKCILAIMDVPDWLVSNPDASTNRIIPPSKYTEFAEMIVSYLIYARDYYNANIPIIGIQNEPNIGIFNYFSPSELADVSEVILDHLDYFGLGHVKLHVGDVNEPGAGPNYYTPSLGSSKISNRAVAISYHTWHNMTPTHLGNIKTYGKDRDIKNWATEVGSSPLDPTTMDWAINSMKNHHLAYTYADASMTFQWCLAGAETSIDKYGNPHRIYYALKHYHQHIFPGSWRVDVGGDTGSLFTTAFIDSDEKNLSMITINADSAAKDIVFNLAAPASSYTGCKVFKTTNSSYSYERQSDVHPGPYNTLSYNVAGRSIHTFEMGYNNAPRAFVEVEVNATNPSLNDYVFYIQEPDGVQGDIPHGAAGVLVFKDEQVKSSILYGDPNAPPFFQTFVLPGGKVLIMKVMGVEPNLGMTILGGGVDIQGALGAVWIDI